MRTVSTSGKNVTDGGTKTKLLPYIVKTTLVRGGGLTVIVI
jgi:hypothetical protein